MKKKRLKEVNKEIWLKRVNEKIKECMDEVRHKRNKRKKYSVKRMNKRNTAKKSKRKKYG